MTTLCTKCKAQDEHTIGIPTEYCSSNNTLSADRALSSLSLLSLLSLLFSSASAELQPIPEAEQSARAGAGPQAQLARRRRVHSRDVRLASPSPRRLPLAGAAIGGAPPRLTVHS